jgi:hypothetical protein
MTLEDQKKSEHDSDSPVPPSPEAQKPGGEKGNAKPKPVFRIVPADPKNTLHFEDAADK